MLTILMYILLSTAMPGKSSRTSSDISLIGSKIPQNIPLSQYPAIENLNQHIEPFEGCLIRVQNPRNTDIQIFTAPFMLFHVAFKKKRSGIMWSAHTKSKTTCVSDLFHNSTKSGSECLAIHFTAFSMKSKPWKCEVNIDIFRPIILSLPLLDPWHKPESWDEKHPHFVKGYKQIVPSALPTINIYALGHEDASAALTDGVIADWIWLNVSPLALRENLKGTKRSKLYHRNDIHILLLTSEYTFQTMDSNRCNITKILALKPTFDGKRSTNSRSLSRSISNTEINLSTLSAGILNIKINLFFSTRHENLAIRPVSEEQGDGNLQLYMEMCQGHKSFRQLLQNPYMADRFSSALLEILQSVIQNYTYIFQYQSCKNGVRLKNEPLRSQIYMQVKRRYGGNNFEFAIIRITDEINTLAFISCGKAKMAGFAFAELLNVFQSEVWIFIVLSNIFLACSLYFMLSSDFGSGRSNSRNLKLIFSIFEQTFKPLVEQGDPFKSTLVAETRLRLSVGAFLLVIIVVSNAYKNTNVYNMISPRQPMPYENLSQLVNDHYTLFSRGIIEREKPVYRMATIITHWKPRIEDTTYDTMRSYVTDSLRLRLFHNFGIVPEISDALKIMDGNFSNNETKEEIELYNQLKNNITFLPGLDVILRDIYEQLWPKNKEILLEKEWLKFLFGAKQFVNRKQQMILNEYISECNQTAFIVPRVEANRLLRSMRGRHQGRVYVGKQNYYGLDYLISFMGHVPPFVVDGIAAMKWTGIANKLVEFAASTYKPAPYARVDPTRATLQGNIAVIFIILMGGLIISCVAFFTEMYRCILKFLGQFFSKLRLSSMVLFLNTSEFIRQACTFRFNR
ncbi:unnamed protein product [Orchesella dallaii]|uniref:Uncharacterized protein n=1 Tax=Orchesella dallaii TaxID=48710 RepID=A0ABP1RTG3_9HEXA